MRTSQRELRGLARAAALGMGYPHGLAEELALAVVWLTTREEDGLGALMATAPRDAPTAGVQIGSDGPGLLDLLIAEVATSEDGTAALQLAAVDSPILLAGLCGVAAATHGVVIDVTCGKATVSITGGAALADFDAAELGQLGGSVEVICRIDPVNHDASSDVARHADAARLFVGDDRWRQAERLASKTYVPATEHSRHHGAGAGVTDND